MTEQTHAPGLWSAPGDGVLARAGDLIVLSGPADAALLDQLLEVVEQTAAAGGNGRRLADVIEDVLGGAARPPVIALGPSGTGLVVLVNGTAWADASTAAGTERLSAGHPGCLLRGTLRQPVIAVHGGLEPGQPGAGRTDRYSHLDRGSVRAGGLSYYPGPAAAGPQAAAVPAARPAPEPAAPPEPDEPAVGQRRPGGVPGRGTEAAQRITEGVVAPLAGPPSPAGQPFEAVLLTGESLHEALSEAGDRPPLPPAAEPAPAGPGAAAEPMIMGAYCKNGHFNDPEARFCAVCGISMNQQTLTPRLGPRPPLGLLLVDTGAVLQLDANYVIGREPELDPAVLAGEARPLPIPDATGTLSRVHAQIQLVDWNVLVTDLGSANGTRIRPPGDIGAEQLVPQVPTLLRPGSRVDLGGRRLHYESHRGR